MSRAARDDSSLVSTATVEGRLAVFDDVWETIQDRYYDPKFHGIDWQAKRTAFRPLAARANSTQEFYDVLRQMIASLKDSHTRVYSPDEKFDWWNPRFVTVGVTTREVEGVPTVIQIEPGSAAARTDIRPGDRDRQRRRCSGCRLCHSKIGGFRIEPRQRCAVSNHRDSL